MKGDFTRFTFDPRKHYDAVLMQQGRVQTDADWNEQVMIAAHRNRTETLDIIGPTGAPQDLRVGGKGAFVVYWDPDENQLFFNQGRYYAGGLMVENETPLRYIDQPGATLPPAEGPGIYLFYLDVWRRHITSLEDPGIRDVALAGADSGTRSQLVWQIRAQKVTEFEDVTDFSIDAYDFPWQPADTVNTGTMDVQAGSTPLENQLYRVEIHRGGTAGTASCKWSRDNGTVVARVLTHTEPVEATVSHNKLRANVWQLSIDIDRNGRDSFSSFLPGQMVELSNDDLVLMRKPGVFATITAVVGNTLTLEVPRASAPLDSNDPILNPLVGTGPTVRRWDNLWNPDDSINATLLNVGPDYTKDGRLLLERDISVKFTAGRDDLYRTGDYWLIPARTVSGLVDWVQDVPQRPAGEEHIYARLALVKVPATGIIPDEDTATNIRDMRDVFPTLRSFVRSTPSLGKASRSGETKLGGIVTGTGVEDYVPKWVADAASEIDSSQISDDGTTVLIKYGLKVGTGTSPNYETVERFTSDAIQGLKAEDLPVTVPTAGGVKTYVEHAVSGKPGKLAKFTEGHVVGNSIVSDDRTTVTVGGNLVVDSGDVTSSALAVQGATTLQGPLTVRRGATLNGGVTVQWAATLNNTLTVEKAATLKNTLTVQEAATLNNTLAVQGAATLKNTLLVQGPATLNNTLLVQGAATLKNTLSVQGAATLRELRVQEAAKLNTTLEVKGAAKLHALAVEGAAALHALTAQGTATLYSTLTVQGVATLNNTLKVGTGVEIKGFTSNATHGPQGTEPTETVPTSQAVLDLVNAVQDLAKRAVPIGTVIAYASEDPPEGWLECDGRQLDCSDTSEYKDLFDIIGTNFGAGHGSKKFNLPDLRGRFIRGRNNGAKDEQGQPSTHDPDAGARGSSTPTKNQYGETNQAGKTGDDVGSYQADGFESHNHAHNELTATTGSVSIDHKHSLGVYSYHTKSGTDAPGATYQSGCGGGPGWDYGVYESNTGWSTSAGSSLTSHQHSVSFDGSISQNGGTETRPKNVYLMYIIKYKH